MTQDGRLRLQPGVADGDLSQLEHTCALDAADEGPRLLADVAELLGVTYGAAWVTEQRARVMFRRGFFTSAAT